jgi:hypothetical protein
MLRHLFLIPFLFIFILFYWGCEMVQEPTTTGQSQQSVTGIAEPNGFELMSMIPENAQIISAELFIYVYHANGNPVNVHRVTADWIETGVDYGVTWNNFAGSYDPVPEIGGSFTSASGWQTADITALVKKWVYDCDPNYGILLEQSESESDNTHSEYHSSEYDDLWTLRPKLVIKFSNYDYVVIQREELGSSIVEDAYIWENARNTNFGSEDNLYTGFIKENEKQSLIKFELPCLTPSPGIGTGTPGYWKNHPKAWPVYVDGIEICLSEITYTYKQIQAIGLMGSPEKGNKTFTMFRALVAAELNVANGTDPTCIDETITLARDWLCTYGSFEKKVPGKSKAWNDEGEPLYLKLDDYNNGLLCAPPRD